ncbi:MAG: adenylate cyclase [Bacteroidia bacterium]|jgi:adenylate cyclase
MRYREFKRHFKIYFVTAIIFMALSVFSRITLSKVFGVSHHGHENFSTYGEIEFITVMILIGSFWLALLSSFLDIVVLKKLVKKKPFGTVIIIGFVAQVGMIVVVISLLSLFYETAMAWIYWDEIPPLTFHELLFVLVYLILATTLSKFAIEMDRKLGPGNLWKVINGRFFKPREEERIFMFVDMKGATSIAEKIGHIEFSKLLQDCFQDFAIVDRYSTDIYQYVGDEVVVSWSQKRGLNEDNFLNAFFAFNDKLKMKSAYYKEAYGITPFFKAGANFGPVVVAEVGDIKREIVYHGDTLNTASRIQNRCNDLNAQLLISENLYHFVKGAEGYNLEDVGWIDLKGKEKDERLYRVTKL